MKWLIWGVVMLGLVAPLQSVALSKDVSKDKVAATQAVINLNTASAKELMSLPGIGKKKAEAIIQYRDENGGFHSIDDLIKVQGVGKKSMDALRGKISVN
ncbi:ComEA family DNA-binding protein [Lacimicrobium alkaliphilum]|uniref:Helix-hairpin-helix DNA-binding motif class 1 domain-containing protein n=1 Tax=Lacimicrobium alkaliphilum TaxID=1526571 RepID=A0A0U2ZH53_9ALTE|nr:helix-hairpin-helix domain-containing protein [Lacimicrobium alkaliphilum]ALS97740.1 hypothetical protein AT746_05270 [Lacimicrobium alkaliphilum]